ncbi:MAG: CFI-box-CTERM domain-containing protein [Syntrophomonas sp.]
MRIKRLLSVILCLVFIMSIFSFSVAAATPEGANMMQMMTLEDPNGPDVTIDNPIKELSDLKTSHKFPEVKGEFEVSVPKAGYEEGYENKSCKVSFIPSIEGNTDSIPFFTAVALDQESIFTIKNNNLVIDERAVIKEEDIYIEHSDLLSTEITVAEEYDATDIYYEIIFRVDFYSTEYTEKPNELIGELEYTVRVYDSPLLGVDVNYEEQISSHYGYWAAYVEEDIWNSTVEVNIKRKSSENDDEPVAGVITNIFYYWGASDNKYCTFKPTEDWVTTDADGMAEFIIGGGGNLVEREIGILAPALYGRFLGTNNESQYYTYPDLEDFKGTLKVKVVNTEGEPLKGRTVQFWGGAKYDDLSGGVTGEDGIAEVRYPSSTTSTDEKELTMTELPTFALKWNVTQVIDNPQRIVEGHKAPLYLSPEIYVSEGYSKNPYTEIRGVKLQVYDVDRPETTLIETSPKAFKEKYDTQRDIIVRGAHRAYIKISPQDLAGKRLGIRAVFPNKDEGAREEYQIRGSVEDPASNHQLYVPKKEFTFAFVPLRVGAEENNSSISYGSLSKQKEFIRGIFPAPIKFVEKSPMFIAKPRFSTHNMYLSRIFRELDRTQKLFSNKYDLYIGMTPTGFLGAAGLQQSGMLGMNWEFLGAAHGAVLVDPKEALSHTTIHEFIHTLGLSDVYPEGGVQLLSANGHDGTPINNVAGHSPANEPIMYDHSGTPWPTEGEYNALLEYATKPAPGKMSLLSMSSFSEESKSEVLLLSGSIEDVRANNRKVYFDPIIKHTGDVDESIDFDSNGYVIQTLASDGGVLSQYFFSDYEYGGKHYANFITNLPAANVKAIEIGKQESGRITQIFQRYEYSANAPEVSLTGPKDASLSGDFMITWEASDADGDALLSEVQVSFDSGNTWDTLAADIPDKADGKYSHIVNAGSFPEGTNYKFKVVVTDGMHSTEALSDNYTIAGYELKPILDLSATEATIKVKPGTTEAIAYFEVGNKGREELNVEFSPNDEVSTFVSPLFIREYTIYPGQNQVIAILLILPGEAESILEDTINLLTNAPDKQTTNLTIKVEYTEDAFKPELALFSTTPSDFTTWEQGSDLQVTFDAYAAAGQSGLEATITIEEIIEDKTGNEILKEQMSENYHKPGVYTYYWEPEELSVGNYGVYIGLKESIYERDRTEGEYDFTFSIKAPNTPPVFVEPKTYENDLGVVERGEKITIPYEVSDQDGDTLDIKVHSNLLEHGLELKNTGNSGSIEWTANVSGAHSIYLTATDPSGNSASVMFNIVEIEDLNIFIISLEAQSTEGGQVYGNGLYNPGQNVIVEAVPEESYTFSGWTEDDDTVVSTDPVYMFKANKDRKLVANFEEAKVFSYEIENNEVIITGFAADVLEDIVIPSEIEGYSVTGISDTAFFLKYIKSANFPETLTNIGTNAFRSNKLTQVIIPNNVRIIGDYAFGFNNDLVEVVIPNGDTAFGEGAFYGCSPNLIIYGVPGSNANTYATGNNITFRNISEYGGEISGDECFIATAAFGSKFTWPVALLRHFRDQFLLTNSWGTAFVSFYYRYSPPIAAIIATSHSLKMLVRILLAPVIAMVYMIYHPILMITGLLIAFLIYRYRLRRRYV